MAVSTQSSESHYLSLVDMHDAFWHVKLSTESARLCTLNTLWGRKCFLRMPFGLCSASEVLRSAITRPSGTSHGVHAIADELIIAGRNEQVHDHPLSQVLNRARSKNIKFSLDRVLYKVYQVKLVHGAPHWTYQPRRDQIPRGSKQFTRCRIWSGADNSPP